MYNLVECFLLTTTCLDKFFLEHSENELIISNKAWYLSDKYVHKVYLVSTSGYNIHKNDEKARLRQVFLVLYQINIYRQSKKECDSKESKSSVWIERPLRFMKKVST